MFVPLIPVMCSQLNVTQSRPTGVHEWLRVAAIETAVSETDMFASTTDHSNIIDLVHMEMLIVGSTGHFDNEIEFADYEGFDGMKSTTSCLRLPRLKLLSLFINTQLQHQQSWAA